MLQLYRFSSILATETFKKTFATFNMRLAEYEINNSVKVRCLSGIANLESKSDCSIFCFYCCHKQIYCNRVLDFFPELNLFTGWYI